LDDHTQVFKLLPAESALGMQLTSAFQLVPEQSTAAIVIHHPEAKYYTVRETAGGGARREAQGTKEQVA
jgi:5-methyltetrahydrofolate--homocysteine methyltransferase